MNELPTAALIIIGNEILTGRTLDINSQFLAKELFLQSINLIEIRIIKDNKQSIINSIRYFHPLVDFIFTTGGIGPTHDDITSESLAEAFDRKYVINEEAARILIDYYKESINDARMKMAYMPENVTLIENRISKAPGFIIENVFVLAGVPKIMQAMFEIIKLRLPKNNILKSESLNIFCAEGNIAQELTQIQNLFSEVEIGSYPYEEQNSHYTSIVMRSINKSQLAQCYEEIISLANKYNNKVK